MTIVTKNTKEGDDYKVTQGVVTHMLPVKAFVIVIVIFDRQKVCLIVPF